MALAASILGVNQAGLNETSAFVEAEVGQAGCADSLPVHQASWLVLGACFAGGQVVPVRALNAAVVVGDVAVGHLGEGVAVVVDQLVVGFALGTYSISIVRCTFGYRGDAGSILKSKTVAADLAEIVGFGDASVDFVSVAVGVGWEQP